MYSDKDFKVSEKSGAFFYTQESSIEGWKLQKFSYDAMDVTLLQKNNGTVRVEIKDAVMNLACDYTNNVWVDWLKNSTGSVKFNVMTDMTFDYALSVQDEKVVVTSQAIGGLKLRQDQVNATVGSDQEQVEESLAVMFSKWGSPALLSIRSKVESLVDEALTTYLKKIKSDTNFVPKNQYKYKVKTTPTKVGVYEDNVLTVHLKTELYSYSTLLTSTEAKERRFQMSTSNSSLLQYNVDENVIAVAVNEFVNK